MNPDYAPPATLPALLRALLTTSHERHWDMQQLVSGLPREALDWRPAPEAASLGGLALHIVDVELYVARLAAGIEGPWAGENGSRMDESGDCEELLAAIDAADQQLKEALAGLTAERLESAGPGGEGTLGEALAGDLDHSAMHYGHLQLTRHLWEASHPDWESGYIHWR